MRPKSGLDMALERVTKYKTNDGKHFNSHYSIFYIYHIFKFFFSFLQLDSFEEEDKQDLSEGTEQFFIDPEVNKIINDKYLYFEFFDYSALPQFGTFRIQVSSITWYQKANHKTQNTEY